VHCLFWYQWLSLPKQLRAHVISLKTKET